MQNKGAIRVFAIVQGHPLLVSCSLGVAQLLVLVSSQRRQVVGSVKVPVRDGHLDHLRAGPGEDRRQNIVAVLAQVAPVGLGRNVVGQPLVGSVWLARPPPAQGGMSPSILLAVSSSRGVSFSAGLVPV